MVMTHFDRYVFQKCYLDKLSILRTDLGEFAFRIDFVVTDSHKICKNDNQSSYILKHFILQTNNIEENKVERQDKRIILQNFRATKQKKYFVIQCVYFSST